MCYILLQTGSLTQFADKTVYIGVVGSDDIGRIIREGSCPFSLDESDAIVKNAIAEEVPCALFELPL